MKNNKILFLTFSFFINSIFVYSQDMTNAKIRILDSETQEGIEQANVLIQELMIVEKSLQFGIAAFNNVPVRQITVEVKKQDYYPKKVELNLTDNPFDNNFSIDLVSQKDNSVAFFGTIKGKGERIDNGTVTIKVGSYKQSVKSDNQGDFSIEIPKNKISSDINVLITHPKFKDKELNIVLKQGEKYKDLKIISLDYSGGNVREMKTIGEGNTNYWRAEVKNWTQENNIVTVNLLVEMIFEGDTSKDLVLVPSRAMIIDENGATYYGVEEKLGNTKVSGTSKKKVPVVKGTKPIVSIKFDVGENKISKISLLRFPYKYAYEFDVLMKN